MSIVRQVPWTEQPQGDVGVDWANPMSSGLLFLAPLNPGAGLRDLVRGQQLTRTGALTPAASRNGVYPTFAASNYLDLPSVPALGTTSPATFAWTQEPRSTAAYSTLLQINFGSGTNAFLIYQSASDANYQLAVGPAGNGGSNNGSAANFAVGSATNNALDRFVLVANSGVLSYFASTYTLWKNGVKLPAATNTTFGSTTAAVARIGATSAGGDPFEGLIGNLHIWQRSLTEAEAAAWSRPGGEFSLLSPRAQRIWAPATTAGAYSLTAQPGVYAVSGQSSTITRSRLIAANAGAYAVTGQSATLTRSRLINASAGAYTYTGQSASITYALPGAYSITALPGAYAITGRSASISYSGAPAPSGLSGVYFDVLSGRLLVLRSGT
jgi:Concanavalin A-like lectin/glucanases superfamily